MRKTEDGKKFLTTEEAIALLPEGDEIHTFYSTGVCLVGADWERSDILQKLTESDCIELSGEQARGMGHGLAAYREGARLVDILFIETDKDKLDQFDPLVEEEDE